MLRKLQECACQQNVGDKRVAAIVGDVKLDGLGDFAQRMGTPVMGVIFLGVKVPCMRLETFGDQYTK